MAADSENTQAFTVRRLLQESARYLAQHDVAEAETVAELLLACLLGCGRMELLPRQQEEPPERLLAAMRRGLRRVAAREPVQYVLGEWDFHDITLKVDSRALIPRPETELLVERVLKSPVLKETRALHLVDVGTGTGAIVLALAHALRNRAEIRFTAVDCSPEALSLARENAKRLELTERVTFLEGSSCGMFEPGSVDVVVSNPPYIASAVVDTLDRHIREHEPRLALDGGQDGLDALRQIVLDAAMVLKPGGYVYFEMGDDQGPSMSRLLEAAGFSGVRIHSDDYGKTRFAEGFIR